jgi:hypothetical protein
MEERTMDLNYGSGYGDGSGYGYGFGNGYGYGDKLLAIKLEYNQEKLTNWYLKEQNSEVRAKIISKIGLEPILAKTKAKVIDSKTMEVGGYYELFECDLFWEKRKFLKMLNPSTKIYHMEWVKPDTNSVEEALKWRNHGYLPDDIS